MGQSLRRWRIPPPWRLRARRAAFAESHVPSSRVRRSVTNPLCFRTQKFGIAGAIRMTAERDRETFEGMRGYLVINGTPHVAVTCRAPLAVFVVSVSGRVGDEP